MLLKDYPDVQATPGRYKEENFWWVALNTRSHWTCQQAHVARSLAGLIKEIRKKTCRTLRLHFILCQSLKRGGGCWSYLTRSVVKECCTLLICSIACLILTFYTPRRLQWSRHWKSSSSDIQVIAICTFTSLSARGHATLPFCDTGIQRVALSLQGWHLNCHYNSVSPSTKCTLHD